MEINLDERIRRFARLYPRIMNWPISRMNDSETKERGLLRVEIQKFPRGVYLQTPLGSLYLRRSFWKSVSIHSRSAPATVHRIGLFVYVIFGLFYHQTNYGENSFDKLSKVKYKHERFLIIFVDLVRGMTDLHLKVRDVQLDYAYILFYFLYNICFNKRCFLT